MDTATGTSILDHFSTLQDPRIQGKIQHKLSDIIVITICAVMAGADDYVDIATYGRLKESWFRTFLELPGGIPSHDTFGRVMSLIAPEEFGKCLIDWIRAVFPTSGKGIIAIDGKTARGSHDRANGKAAIHMVSAWAVEDHLILGQVKTEEKSNEITAIPELLKTIDVEGCTVTIDAMDVSKRSLGRSWIKEVTTFFPSKAIKVLFTRRPNCSSRRPGKTTTRIFPTTRTQPSMAIMVALRPAAIPSLSARTGLRTRLNGQNSPRLGWSNRSVKWEIASVRRRAISSPACLLTPNVLRKLPAVTGASKIASIGVLMSPSMKIRTALEKDMDQRISRLPTDLPSASSGRTLPAKSA